MKVQRHLPPEKQELLREVVARHRTEYLPLLDELYDRPLKLEERRYLARAIVCETYQRGHERNELTDLWNLTACIGLGCALNDYQLSLLNSLLASQNSGLIHLLEGRARSSWTQEQRDSVRKTVVREWIARKKRGEIGRNERTEIGHLLWRLRGHIYVDTTLHPDDLAVFHAVVKKWSPKAAFVFDTLGEMPLRREVRHSLYNAITAEMQDSGEENRAYIDQLEGLIDYVGHLPKIS